MGIQSWETGFILDAGIFGINITFTRFWKWGIVWDWSSIFYGGGFYEESIQSGAVSWKLIFKTNTIGNEVFLWISESSSSRKRIELPSECINQDDDKNGKDKNDINYLTARKNH